MLIADGVRLLTKHVDGLHVACEIPHVPLLISGADDLELQLNKLQRRARRHVPNGPEPTGWTWGTADAPVLMMPTALQRNYRYCLQTPDWAVFIAAAESFVPRILLTLRAAFLLSKGACGAYEEARRWVDTNLLPLVGGMPANEGPTWRIARIDLAADVAGVDFALCDSSAFTTRASKRRGFETADAPRGAVSFVVGRRLTGFTFGQRGRAVYCRIYDKTLQASPDAPIRQVWQRNGYAPADSSRVWRIEFELRSRALRDFVADDRHLDLAVERVLDARILDAIWSYLVTDWLILRDRSRTYTRIERAPVEPWWGRLDTCRLFAARIGTNEVLALERRRRVPTDSTRLLKIMAGGLASLGAINGNRSLCETLDALAGYMHLEVGQKRFEALVERAEGRRSRSTLLATLE